MRSALMPVVALLVSSMLPLAAPAADREDVMRSRYLKSMFCSQQALGNDWPERHGVRTVVNRWGISEPTRRTLEAAPAKVQEVDAKCRKANELEDEKRPVFAPIRI